MRGKFDKSLFDQRRDDGAVGKKCQGTGVSDRLKASLTSCRRHRRPPTPPVCHASSEKENLQVSTPRKGIVGGAVRRSRFVYD